jgi:predicted Zn-dependent peptidase
MFNEFDTMGAVYNAATTAQHTYYYVYGNADDTKKLLDIMLDIYINPVFNVKEINKERKVIIEEMRMRSDSPLMKLYSALHKKMFVGTSLARDIIGTEETVNSLKKKDFITFRKSLYKPDNTVFVIAGNFNPVPIYKMIERALKPVENTGPYPITYYDEKPMIIKNMEDQEEPYVYIKKNTLFQQVYIILAFPLYDLYKDQYREIDLISQLLSAGFSSRLYKALREDKGITYSSSAYPITYADCGMFIIQMVMNPAELVTGLKILMKVLKKTKDELITKEELKKIVNYTKNEAIFSMTKSTDILVYYGLNFLYNKNFKPDVKEDFEDLKKVTRVQIQKTAKEIFVRDKINLYIYGNVEETDFNFLDL